ncbi:hypothetical protein AAEX63_08135 [Luteococcus sp. H138]|uniref:hypothetical protein n=1 Tax=unclassified Luteococcus TaxID=2639923 RepID=UPI00313C9E9D
MVEEDRTGRIVGAALRMPNPIHPRLDYLDLAVVGDASVDLVHAVAQIGEHPALLRAIPGSRTHELALAAGATVFERVPAACIDPADPQVIQWAISHQGDTRSGTGFSTDQLTDLWIDFYVRAHQHFGVTSDRSLVRSQLRGFVSRAVDPTLTRIVETGGRPVAIAFAFREGPSLMALVDSLQPDHPDARHHVEVALAALLQGLPPEPIELDGHESGQHYPAVLATIPNVTAGPLTPMELLKISQSMEAG